MKRPFFNAFQSLLHDRRHFVTAICIRLGFLLSDKAYLKLMFRLQLRKPLDLDTPLTYNEKLQWLKLYYHRSDFTMMADKVAVKKFVAERIGQEYVIPLLGVWNSVKDIEWDKLPPKFVLKTNHDGGNFGVVICRKKADFDRSKAERRLHASLSRNTFLLGREWPYKNIPRKVFAEMYIENGSFYDLPDYKFFCFDGKVQLLYVASNRQSKSGVCIDYYDASFNHLDLKQSHPHAPTPPQRPPHFDLMKKLAEDLSKGIPHVRVDFFEAGGRVYFSEFTFYTFGGWAPFYPEEYDYKLGACLSLPSEMII